MAMNGNATDLYRAHSAQLQTDKQQEYETILDVTRKLKRAQNTTKMDFEKLAITIADNRQLWIAIASVASSDRNMLSSSLRAGLVYLNEFVAVQSSKVLQGKATIEPLIQVNVSVLKGLAGKVEDR